MFPYLYLKHIIANLWNKIQNGEHCGLYKMKKWGRTFIEIKYADSNQIIHSWSWNDCTAKWNLQSLKSQNSNVVHCPLCLTILWAIIRSFESGCILLVRSWQYFISSDFIFEINMYFKFLEIKNSQYSNKIMHQSVWKQNFCLQK